MDKMNSCNTGVYTITNLKTTQIYVGSTRVDFSKRFKQHIRNLNNNKHSNVRLQNSWNKYGSKCFSFNILEEVKLDGVDDALVLAIEQYWLNQIDPYYNIQRVPFLCSNKGIKKTKDQMIKRSKSLGVKAFEICKDGEMVEQFEILTECSKKYSIGTGCISACLKGTRKTAKGYRFRYVGEDFVFYPKKRIYKTGRRHSEETKAKMSSSRFGHKMSDESKRKLSNSVIESYKNGRVANKYYMNNEEKLAHSKKFMKGLIVMTDLFDNEVGIFDSMKQLCIDYNLHQAAINRVINGKQKQHKGYKFKRIEKGIK